MCDATSLDGSDEEMEGRRDERGPRMAAETKELAWCHRPDEAMTDTQLARPKSGHSQQLAIGHVMRVTRDGVSV